MKNKPKDDTFLGVSWSMFMTSLSNLLSERHNVNDNVGKALPNNDNVNIVRRTKGEVDAIADKLVTELNNPGARLFYCKVAWTLSESDIYKNLEIAKMGRNPQKYFSWLCKHNMK
jgi:hypothetical protein